MILTGRPVYAEEALEMGLANRAVEVGGALAAAQTLATDIVRFPSECMKTDRISVYRQWDLELNEALRFEGREGAKPLRDEARAGANRFVDGAGRGGQME